MKVLSLSLLLLTATIQITFGQSTIKAKELKEVLKRPVIVELIEESKEVLKILNSKISRESREKSERGRLELEKYQSGIAAYNQNIQELFKANWQDGNSEVKFMTTSDILKKIESKETSHSVFLLGRQVSEYGVGSWNTDSNLSEGAHCFIFSKIEDLEKDRTPHEGILRSKGFFSALVSSNESNEISKGSLKLSLRIMTKYMGAFLQKGSNTLYMNKFLQSQAKLNCQKLTTQDLHISESFIHSRASIEKIANSYSGQGTVKELDSDSYEELLLSNDSKVVGISIPKKVLGPDWTMDIHCVRAFINLKTLDVYTASGSGAMKSSPYFMANEFQKYGICK